MSNCKYTNEQIIKYVTCKMTRDDETKFQYHLLQCDECWGKVERFRRLRDEFIEMFKEKMTIINKKFLM